MVIPSKILIDTNVAIGLEDNKKVDKSYSNLSRLCVQNGVKVLIHEASYDDVNRDPIEERKKISLSKLDKYPKINKTKRTIAQKEVDFGSIKSPNDDVDTDLLFSLSVGLFDLLITEDRKLISRVADNPVLVDKVLTVNQALELFEKELGIKSVEYPNIQQRKCNEFHHDDPFFESLKGDYPDFEGWYEKCMKKERDCWIILSDDEAISGMLIYKDEDEDLTELCIPGNRVLKLCLFKTDESIRGEKYGEQLLKTAMDYAFRNGYDTTYVTTFSKQAPLIHVLSKFGFDRGNDRGGEHTYYKHTKIPEEGIPLLPFDFHKKYWPCLKVNGAKAYIIPIKPQFHSKLFPMSDKNIALQMAFDFSSTVSQTPGNAIRKVYVCNAPTKQIDAGSVLLFYRSEDQLITTIGVLENYTAVDTIDELSDAVGKRSVYTLEELMEKLGKKYPPKVVNFYYAQNLSTPVKFDDLLDLGILNGVPQSITGVTDDGFKTLLDTLIADPDKEIFYKGTE